MIEKNTFHLSNVALVMIGSTKHLAWLGRQFGRFLNHLLSPEYFEEQHDPLILTCAS
jgi:hypothetical protein